MGWGGKGGSVSHPCEDSGVCVCFYSDWIPVYFLGEINDESLLTNSIFICCVYNSVGGGECFLFF